eukprot:7543346-Pyramimonas_sp.AAC.1
MQAATRNASPRLARAPRPRRACNSEKQADDRANGGDMVERVGIGQPGIRTSALQQDRRGAVLAQ